MEQKITENQVRQVAKLSRLALDDEQITQFTEQMGSILGYIEKLNELDVESVPPLAHCLPIHNVFRQDEIKPSLDPADALANAPQTHENYFKVPKILDTDSTA